MELIAKTATLLRDQLRSNISGKVIPITSLSSECGCGGTGWNQVTRDGRSGVAVCECRKKSTASVRLLELPALFREASFSNYKPNDDAQAEALYTIRNHTRGSFYLHGICGRGKTHLAAAQYHALVDAGVSCRFVSMHEMLQELRRAEMDSSFFSAIIDRVYYAESFHLFIDDIDKFKPTEFKAEALFDLVDTIYRRKLSFTCTGNWDLRKLMESGRLDASILRRIDDMCRVVKV